jgi:hypothetical protein
MGNTALQRRLAEIEAKSDEAAKAIEPEYGLTEERRISPEETERTYRQFVAAVRRDAQSCKLSLDEATREYFRLIREPAPSRGTRR